MILFGGFIMFKYLNVRLIMGKLCGNLELMFLFMGGVFF